MRKAPERVSVPLVRGVDGDTVKVKIGALEASVRLLGMDTPETHFLGKSQGKWADEASEVLKDIIRGSKTVTLEFEGARCDRYGRILAYVYLGKEMLNQAMLERALAVNYCISPNFRYCERFAKITHENIVRRAGIFSDPKLELPYIWRKRVARLPFDKYIGSIRTRAVYSPTSLAKVPVAERVFFYQAREIKTPYFQANVSSSR